MFLTAIQGEICGSIKTMLCIQSRLPQNTSGFLPDMNAQIGALNDFFPLVIALNSWTGGKLSKVNYQRSFIQTSLSHYNINIVFSFPVSLLLVPRLLQCRNFQLTEYPFYSRRFIYVILMIQLTPLSYLPCMFPN